jgi:ElaB/YqjD/DUF883 family membrane-anchored ribosome-binding protein
MEQSEYTPSQEDANDGNGVAAIAAKAEEKMRELRDTARSQAEHRVQELGEKAQHRIDDQRDRVAARIEETASKLRQRADAAGPIGHTAAEKVAVRMEAAAGYLHQHQTSEIAGDFTSYVRQHPFRAVIAAAVLGYLFGRLTG